jgi:hypothetical protein
MNETLTYAAGFIGQEKAETAAKYAAAAGLEVMKYDPIANTFYLSDGEPYTSKLFFSWFSTVIH